MRYRRIAAELRRLRELKGLSAEEVVAQVPGINLVKLSRYENARVQLKADVVRTLLDFYECEPELKEVLVDILQDKRRPGWVASFEQLNPLYTDLIRLEEIAVSSKAYEASYIPGLLQTRQYAHTIISSAMVKPPSLEAQVDVRINRQAVLTRKEAPLKLWAVIHESALSMAADPGVMTDQLDKLVQFSSLPNVKIQVMPALAPPHPGMTGAFALLEFRQRDLDLVLQSGMLTSNWVEDPDHVDIYRAAFDEIMATALDLDQSLALIKEKRDQLK
ncbi:helix-turn-helix domain-containing protein [Kitasatospora sp. NBC_01287]|uniref:helix-turn-helix domain-containing protein n=1 Tax=Kitasatospora sp. NBC_01287 TaxID=2903573 RepID=UPI00224FCC61|nr:helix-turn-helix transcriptional regulator [Kitasatospora sp. NBC_01287]MCX4749190.1 helix-turn-helix domain-containing protein [Kitasatospora sp. NBC_01287]